MEIESKGTTISIKSKKEGKSSRRFLAFLIEMYKNHCKSLSFDVIVSQISENKEDSYAELFVSCDISSALAFENGLHCYEGKDSSVLSVVVLPSCKEITIDSFEKEVKIEVFHSSGKGGQNVNKVETAVRVTHVASGISVVCQDERSQRLNKERAMKILEQRVYVRLKGELYKSFAEEKHRLENTKQIVRVYNDLIVTDRRSKVSLPIASVLAGDILAFNK